MEILDLIPNTDEWLKARMETFNASEAAAMMNESKFMTRNQLLDLKKGWKDKPLSFFKEKLFKKGHDVEDKARAIIELELMEEYPPVVGRLIDGDIIYQASFDGVGEFSGKTWEHKLWNDTLADNTRNNVLEPDYYWQLEHQLFVAGNSVGIFTVSDGTKEKRVNLYYESLPERREKLIAGWKQFAVDLEAHEIKAKVEKVEAQEQSALPVLAYEVIGSVIASNIDNMLVAVKERAKQEMERKLETDQDFADKKAFNKMVKKAREDLKEVVADIEAGFESFSKLSGTAKEIDGVLQKMFSHGEKQVKEEEKRKKESIRDAANNDLLDFIAETNERIAPLDIASIVDIAPDWAGSMKGKRTIESLQNAVDSELAATKALIAPIALQVEINLGYLRDNAQDYKFLFSDVKYIINQSAESFNALVNQRIADHKAEEERKLEAERERIKIEEEKKLEAEREKIRKEEEAKAAAKLEAEKRAEQERLEQEKAKVVASAPNEDENQGYDIESTAREVQCSDVAQSDGQQEVAAQISPEIPEKVIKENILIPESKYEAVSNALEQLGFSKTGNIWS